MQINQLGQHIGAEILGVDVKDLDAETFGASPTVVGILTASYAAAQLVGAPILGRLSDRYGRRPILL